MLQIKRVFCCSKMPFGRLTLLKITSSAVGFTDYRLACGEVNMR